MPFSKEKISQTERTVCSMKQVNPEHKKFFRKSDMSNKDQIVLSSESKIRKELMRRMKKEKLIV